MFHVDWAEVATDALLEELHQIAGVVAISDNEKLRDVVAIILAHCGGLPVTAENWSNERRTAIGRQLLHEALGAALRRVYGYNRPLPGCDFVTANPGDSDMTLDRQLTLRPRLDLNMANATQLEALPVLGPALTRRIVAERRASGSFYSTAELARRVNGIGDSGASRLDMMLYFSSINTKGNEDSERVFANDFTKDFKLLLSFHASDTPSASLNAALEALVMIVAATPHPATSTGRVRHDLHGYDQNSAQIGLLPTEQIEVLEDEAYYPRLRELLGKAAQRIDVAMFFAAFPGPTHPTRALLEGLADAHDGGASVRVLLDRDREDDPYGSRVINAEAIAFLLDRGVSVRTDLEESLLHSKFIAIDEQVSVIGSHNWTAGSYFRYHDTSLALTGSAFTKTLHARFDRLWVRGQEVSSNGQPNHVNRG